MKRNRAQKRSRSRRVRQISNPRSIQYLEGRGRSRIANKASSEQDGKKEEKET
jgi:hypothetical protein